MLHTIVMLKNTHIVGIHVAVLTEAIIPYEGHVKNDVVCMIGQSINELVTLLNALIIIDSETEEVVGLPKRRNVEEKLRRWKRYFLNII